MPLKKLLLKPGVNKENTRYTNENGWYISDKVRFRKAPPKKLEAGRVFLGIRFLVYAGHYGIG